MKLVTIIAMLSAAVVLSAAETALLDANSVAKATSKGANVVVKDGTVTLSGTSGAEKYNYIFTRATVAPVVTQGKKLSITVEPAETFKGDSVYVKGLNAEGKEVFSYVAYGIPAEKKTYVLELGKESGVFRWLNHQIKAAPETPVTFLQFFYGRATKNSDMKITFSDIKLID